MFIPHHLFFTFFLKINRPVFSVSSHGGNFTSPFPFLSPFSEVCLALVQASCETWEYWVTCAVYLIPNVSASLTYIINCLYFTQQSLPCSFCSLTPCLTNKLELCSVRHRVTSVFFSPSACNTLAEQSWTFVWHHITHSSSWIRCFWSFSQPFQNLTNSVFFADLVDSQPPFSRSFLNILNNSGGSMES